MIGAKKMGANIYITHFHKGFGTEAEREEMEKTRELIKLCHKHGMRVGVYIRPDSLVYETFLAQEPSARDWFQVTADGSSLKRPAKCKPSTGGPVRFTQRLPFQPVVRSVVPHRAAGAGAVRWT